MGLRTLDDGGYHGGMNRDKPSWMLDKGEVYDALNMMFDKPGIARQRQGSDNLNFVGNQNSFCTMLGWVYSINGGVVIEELYGCDGKGNGHLWRVVATSGATTDLGAHGGSNATFGRPVRHFGFLTFPFMATTPVVQRLACMVAGQSAVGTMGSTVAVAFVAGQQQLTLGGADVTTNVKVGGMVTAFDNVANRYYGRVVSIDSATKFTVWPIPPVTFNTAAGGCSTQPFVTSYGGACAASFQNRLLYGNTVDLGSTGQTLINDRRIYYGGLPTQNVYDQAGGGFIGTGGASFVDGWHAFPKYNYVDAPGTDPVIAMEPVSDNELLILTSTHPVILRGNLVTQSGTTAQQTTFDVSEINEPYGCLSDLSVHRTPRGIVWAGPNGIYAYTGNGNVVDLTKGKISTYWRSITRGPNGLTIHGASYVRGLYIISGVSNNTAFALACDMNNLTWTRMSGTGTDNFFSIARPTDPSQIYAARWWDQNGAAPANFQGQIIRLESMADQYSVGTQNLEADNTAIPFSITTRTLAGDSETQKLQARMTARYQAAIPAPASVTVTAQSRIDAADVTASAVRTLGTLQNTEPRVILAATNATPIACTTTFVHGLQSGDIIDINGGTGLTHINGRWRITVTSNLTFTLDGSSGNGVYGASSATLKKFTETDFATNSLDLGQGVGFTIASVALVNNFELHGIRIAYYEKPSPVMSG